MKIGSLLFACILAACESPAATPMDGEFQLLRTVGSAADSSRDTTLGTPRTFVASKNGQVYLADRDGKTLRVFGTQPPVVSRTIGRAGAGPGEFSNVQSIAIAPDGRVAVSDRSNKKIAVFDSTGSWLRDFVIQSGSPDAITFDTQGRLYVAQPTSAKRPDGSQYPIVRVYSPNMVELFGIGGYRIADDPSSNGFLNSVSLTPAADGGVFLLYTYQGYVEHYDANGKMTSRFAIPLEHPTDTIGPFMKLHPDGRASFARMPVATDVQQLADESLVIAALEKTSDGYFKTRLLVYDDKNRLIMRTPQGRTVAGLGSSQNELFVIRSDGEQLPVLEVYSNKRIAHKE